ncbi:hypothetical protein ABVT39_002071 [Epinephelus coioides]
MAGHLLLVVLMYIVGKESSLTQTVTTSLMTTGLTLPAAGTLTPADTTLMKPASGDEETESLILVIGAVVTVGVLLPGLALLFTQSRTEKSVSKRPKTIVTGLLDGFDETYSIVTYECSSALLPPKLTVNPAVITETETVTLNCQTPSSVSVSQCYFRIGRGKPAKVLSCLKNLTGTELLEMTHQSSPAEVKVTCFYLYGSSSPDSDVSSIIIRTSLPPKLTVNPAVINDTDSVTLNCQTPSSVSVSQCHFYTVSGGTAKVLSCLQTLTATELLEMAHQSSPARIQVTCFYTVKIGEFNYPSSHSDTSSITIHTLPPPELTVYPTVITETDSLTLNCQMPSSVSVSQCYFRTVRGGPGKVFSCLKTLTGSELLKMTSQSSPAEVKVTCFYLHVSPSPDSDMSSITIHTLLPPTLTVNPAVITETETVTLNCQTPSSVSVSQCYFYTTSGGPVRVFSCMKTLTGSQLLEMAGQSSPAEVKVKCYYLVTYRSPHSDTSSIIIQTSQLPTLMVNPVVITETDSVTLNCQTPSSVSVSQCYFYTVGRDSPTILSCRKTLTGTELLNMAHQSSPAEVKVKCFYTVKLGDLNSPSPHSDTSSITIYKIVERESYMTPTMPTFSMTTGLTVNNPGASTPVTLVKTTSSQTIGTPSDTGASIFTFLTSVKPEADNCVFNRPKAKVAGLPHGYDETYSIILYECNTEKCSSKRQKTNVTGLPDGYDETYSIVTYECDTALPPPELTVYPTVITETDSLTLNCQMPSSVSVSQCYFRTVRGGPAKGFSCLKTLTGSELLKMTRQSSPAEVKVTCFYLHVSPSPDSDMSSITIHTLLPPKLTVNPAVITETETVTLSCQTPSSVSVSQCYFYTTSGGPVRVFSCMKTLTGSQLLEMAGQSPPAEVKVKCYYLVTYRSPHSDTSSIIIQTLPPPTLTVYPPMITETETVILNCQPPSSVSVSQCYFYTLSGGIVRVFSCLKTLTGSELLKMAHQSSPAEVKVKCAYNVKSQSPDSEASSVTIQTLLPPTLTVYPAVITETETVTLDCQTPSSVSVSQCYFLTLSGGAVRVFSCLKTLTGSELLKMAHQSSPAEVKVKCFYTVKVGERDSPSPHSDTASITIYNVVEKESSMPPIMPTLSMSTGLADSRTHASTPVPSVKQTSVSTVGMPSNTDTSTSPTSVKPASEMWIWNIVVAVAGFGVTAGVIILVSAILWIKRTGEKCVYTATYHMYATIADEPPSSDLRDVMYSKVLKH